MQGKFTGLVLKAFYDHGPSIPGKNNMIISVFGGSEPKPGEHEYEEAVFLGRCLAEAGHTVQTGGYIGTMEAVSRGAAGAGGHVIGITCDEIEAWRPVTPNKWVKEEIRFPTQRQRLFALVESCEAALVLPGGIGTLAEMAVTWSHLQTGAIPEKPLILVGPDWQSVIETIYRSLDPYIKPQYRRLLTLVPDAIAACKILLGKDVQPRKNT